MDSTPAWISAAHGSVLPQVDYWFDHHWSNRRVVLPSWRRFVTVGNPDSGQTEQWTIHAERSVGWTIPKWVKQPYTDFTIRRWKHVNHIPKTDHFSVYEAKKVKIVHHIVRGKWIKILEYLVHICRASMYHSGKFNIPYLNGWKMLKI